MNGLLVLAMVMVVAVAANSQASPHEAAVRNIIQDEIAAWNAGDAVAFARHFAADGTFTNIRGQFFTGREAFTERHDFIFKGIYRGTTMKQDVVSLKFIRPDVAVVETLTAVIGIQKLTPGMSVDTKGRLRSRLLQVMVKDGGDWKIVTFHNTDVRPDVPVPDPQ
ncbi:MAG: SgcJ/EcaC family oxidoreductase [Terriglobales bacterium]|jgi:uncharacterized protein (TIGR02246 family)